MATATAPQNGLDERGFAAPLTPERRWALSRKRRGHLFQLFSVAPRKVSQPGDSGERHAPSGALRCFGTGSASLPFEVLALREFSPHDFFERALRDDLASAAPAPWRGPECDRRRGSCLIVLDYDHGIWPRSRQPRKVPMSLSLSR